VNVGCETTETGRSRNRATKTSRPRGVSLKENRQERRGDKREKRRVNGGSIIQG